MKLGIPIEVAGISYIGNIIPPPSKSLESTSILQQLLNLLPVLAVLDDGLEVRVATDVDLANEDVGDGALAGHLVQGVLDVIAVALLVELVGLVLCVQAVEDALRVVAVGAVRLAKDHYSEIWVSSGSHQGIRSSGVVARTDSIVINHLLGLLLSGFHGY